MKLLRSDVDEQTEAMVDELVAISTPDEIAARAAKEAILAKLTAALAAGRARDALIIGGVNLLLLLCILILK